MNNLIQEIHEKAKLIAKKFHQSEAELIDILQQVERERVFFHLGYSCLFTYAVREMGLSESNAYNFIAVARKAKEIPELKQEISLGNLSVSKARKITPVLTRDNSNLWLQKAKDLPQKALEKEVAKVIPKEATPEKAKYVTETRIDLRLGVEEVLMKKLRRAQDLLSQKRRKPVSLEEVMDEVFSEYIDRNDPVKKAQRNQDKKTSGTKPVARQAQKANKLVRETIKAEVKHDVMLRDQGQCDFIHSDGTRCQEQRWLEMHHILPVSQGGKNNLNNIKLLCSAHHKHMHYQLGM